MRGEGSLPPALVCRECDAKVAASMHMRMPSAWEQCMSSFLKTDGFAVITEYKAMQARWGAIDFWLPAFSVGLMVDGEQHFPSHHGSHHNSSSHEQAARDARFNDAVLSAGGSVVKGLVRLHHHDMRYWMRHVWRAVVMSQQQGVTVFVIFSKSYGVKDAII
jgi:hypothetical protein